MVCMIEYWIVCKAMLMFGIEMYTGTSYVGWLPIITWFWWAFKDAVWYSNNSMSFQTPWITIIPKHAAVVNEFQVLCIYTVTSAWTTRAYQLKSMEPNLKQLFLNLKQGATVGASIGCRVPHQSKTQVQSTNKNKCAQIEHTTAVLSEGPEVIVHYRTGPPLPKTSLN